MKDNELIAEFMGYERSREVWDEGEHAYTMKIPQAWNKWVIPSKMQYSTSWDWLMPVLEKIESLGHDTNINAFHCGRADHFQRCSIENKDIGYQQFGCNSESKIKSVYLAVVEYIKWYNSQKQ
jgi:hypothetical protein